MKRSPLAEILLSSNAGYWGGDPGTGDTDVRVVRNGDIKGDGIRWAGLPVRSLSAREVQKSQLRQHDVLLTTSGDPGQVALITATPEQITCATNFVRVLRFDPERVLPGYAYHYLSSVPFRSAIAPFVRGTTLKNLSTREAFQAVTVPVPPIEEQRRIAAILDHAYRLRRSVIEKLEALSSLEVSVFRDSFASDVAVTTVADVADKVRTGPFGSQLLHGEFVDEGVAVLGLDNVVGNRFRWAQRRYITTTKYEQLKRYTVHPGDVLISIMGTVGRCVVVPEGIPLAINTKHICAVTPDQTQVLPVFLRAAFLSHPTSTAFLRQQTKGAIMDGLNMGIIKSMPLPVPTIRRQEEYVREVAAIQREREQAECELAGAEELVSSLQMRAFSGRL